MRLNWVEFQDFRCYTRLRIEPGRQPVQLYVAENGGGKTALIDGLSAFVGLLAWAGSPDHLSRTAPIQHSDVRLSWSTQGGRQVPLRHYPCSVSGEVSLGDKTIPWGRALNTERSHFNGKARLAQVLTEHFKTLPAEAPLPLVARYSVSRFTPRASQEPEQDESPLLRPAETQSRIAERAMTRSKELPRAAGYGSAMAGGVPWSDLREWWGVETIAASIKQQDETQAITACQRAIMTLLDLPEPPRYDLDLADLLIQLRPGGLWTPVSQVSDGYRTTLGIAADLARRAYSLNPAFGPEAAQLIEGVVLIDEVDQHLHPAWQRQVLGRLHKAFPKIQFFVTTHAPAVIVGAGEDLADVYVLEDKDGQPQPVPTPYTPGASQDDLLTGPTFKLNSAVDNDTLRLIGEHGRLYRASQDNPELIPEYERLSEELQARLGQTFSSSAEDLVMDVVTELARDGVPLSKMRWKDLQALRARALQIIRSAR